MLEQPVVAGIGPPLEALWHHRSVHNYLSDPELSDGQWRRSQAEFVDAVGVAPAGDPATARWVAVRHDADHVHIVATLVRQDGGTVWARQDLPNRPEVRYGPTDRYANR
ncbi:hypothetical protein [Virgisporangium aurantiacum]|nr:hypothetical protein [Virgisporangium aurantiacum]